jgi:glutaryl-CoA dehydrogenase
MSDPTDFYEVERLLDAAEREVLHTVRSTLRKTVTPMINEYWTRAEFPHELIPVLRDLGIAGLPYAGVGRRDGSPLLDGLIFAEIASVDPSIATFHGVHSGLAMSSVQLCGSAEQRERWLPAMADLQLIGAFALTEPEGGSGVAGGMVTTARREGDDWILNGRKTWIGNATFADLIVVWARDAEDNQVKGFVVEKDTPGFHTRKLEDKIALRIVQNAEITLENVRVPEANRLQAARSFRDTAKVLRLTRASVAWMAVGCARGAFELALAYAKSREQFATPASCSGATGSCSNTTLAGSSPTPRPSTPTRARGRSTP